jgi:hypothetical protein
MQLDHDHPTLPADTPGLPGVQPLYDGTGSGYVYTEHADVPIELRRLLVDLHVEYAQEQGVEPITTSQVDVQRMVMHHDLSMPSGDEIVVASVDLLGSDGASSSMTYTVIGQ